MHEMNVQKQISMIGWGKSSPKTGAKIASDLAHTLHTPNAVEVKST